MSGFPTPAPLFNPVTNGSPLSPTEIFAGPFGLLAFAPLVPVVLLLARRNRRAALITGGLIWLIPTLRPAAAGVLLGSLVVATGWLMLLRALRLGGRLNRPVMTALVWVGLAVMTAPLWWYPQWWWYPSRMAALHNAGFAYFLLRFIAWGVSLAREPGQSLRFLDTLCWLLYPPCMRLGPVLLRERFLERLDAWDPRRSPAWAEAGKRFGLFVLGGVALAVVGRQLPVLAADAPSFFAEPQRYSTELLLRAFYLVPIQIYLLLWTYNELAVALSLCVGLRVDDNFRWLPLATSVRDFWHRWHVTVGAWLRDYVYIPVGGNRGFVPLHYVIVFAFCGLWHGASWSFLAWGMTQAAALVAQRAWDRLRTRLGWQTPVSHPLWTAVCWLLTMHYQIATVVVFTDFDHLGLPLFGELARRILGAGG